ncbi:hypothetical protein Cni_G22528 [Canna indica]|uniref:RRM domain-containing protein n=1 Tax=Canna indica TaxID=4628 RepID=A0AAQ3KSB0_9LILI|nr:hypothetical protein Cni_G22528 [Canna indica]
MLNPRAPPFECSPPPPPPPPPFSSYFLPPPFLPPYHVSSPPYFYPPSFSHNFFDVNPSLLLLPPPPPPVLPSNQLVSDFSNLTIQGFQEQLATTQAIDHLSGESSSVELVEHHDNNTPPPPQPPSPPPPPQFTKKKYHKSREKKPSVSFRRVKERSKQFDGSMEFDQNSSHSQVDQRTTVMIRNIPNKFSRDMLIELLDQHCAKENKEAAPPSAYDFVYLPMDFKSGCNLGYAFVNFTTVMAAHRLFGALNGQRWTLFGSKKISHVCYARIQGRRALEEHFWTSCFECDAAEYLPAVMSPPRDGLASLPAPVPVGIRHKGYRQ